MTFGKSKVDRQRGEGGWRNRFSKIPRATPFDRTSRPLIGGRNESNKSALRVKKKGIVLCQFRFNILAYWPWQEVLIWKLDFQAGGQESLFWSEYHSQSTLHPRSLVCKKFVAMVSLKFLSFFSQRNKIKYPADVFPVGFIIFFITSAGIRQYSKAMRLLIPSSYPFTYIP